MYMNSMDRDIVATYGPITALVMKRKRAMLRYDEVKFFRSYGDRYLREIKDIEIEIILALQFGA